MTSSTYRSDDEKKLDEQSKAIDAVSTLIARIEKKTADKDFAGLSKHEDLIKEIEGIREGIDFLYKNPVDLLATENIGGVLDKLSNKRVELADKLDTLESKLKEIQENALMKVIATVLTTENRPGLNSTMINAELKEACQIIRDNKGKLEDACKRYNEKNANNKGFVPIEPRQVKLKVVETENKLGHRSKVLFNKTRTKLKDKLDEIRIKLGAKADKIVLNNIQQGEKEENKIVEKFDADKPKRFRR